MEKETAKEVNFEKIKGEAKKEVFYFAEPKIFSGKFHIFKTGNAEMTDLKTLKDFREHTFKYNKPIKFEDTYLFELLKKEAIKWVKQHRNIKPNWAKETNEEFFMAFFNLTEVDLQKTNLEDLK